MKVTERWLLHAANILVGGTGLVYGAMKYLLTSADEFAVVNHPWQPLVQHLHIWTAPLLVLLLGHILYDHAWRHWSHGVREGRRSGFMLMLFALPMVFSGYFLQTAVLELWRVVWATAHVATSLLWLGGYAAHFLAHRGPSPARESHTL